MGKLKYQKSSFTLIELLIVIAIIGLLSMLIMVSVSSVRQKARDTRRVSDLKQISIALEQYYNDKGVFPSGNYDSRNLDQWNTFSGFLSPEYIESVPVDPMNNKGDGSMCGNCGEYYYSGTSDKYIISTYLATSQQYVTGSNQWGAYYSVTTSCAPTTFWSCN